MSWDGRTYHQAAIMLLSKGWNPVFDNVYTYAAKLFETKLDYLIWVENFPKYAEILEANISLFFSIEYSKVINFLSVYVLFFYSFSVLSKRYFCRVNCFSKIILSFLFSFSPVVIAQLLTFYVDSLLCIFVFLILFAILDIETTPVKKRLPFIFILLFATCLANIKLNGIVCVVLIYFVYSLYLIITKQKNKLNLIFKIFFIFLILLFITGINPYFTNLKQERNILYPLAGDNKIDIMTHNTPIIYRNQNVFRNLFVSTFSTVNNSISDYDNKNILKVPFLIYKKELYFLHYADVRVCGFGVLWSGIVLLSLILFFLDLKDGKNKKDNKIYVLMLLFLFLLLLTNPYSWWARYVPYAWGIPLFIVLFSIKNNRKKANKLTYYLLLFMFLNILIYAYFVVNPANSYRNKILALQEQLLKNKKSIMVYNISDWSIINKLEDKGINIEYVDTEFYEKNFEDFSQIPLSVGGYTLWNYHE